MKQPYVKTPMSWYSLTATLAVVLFFGYLLTHPCKRLGPGRCYSNFHFIDCTLCLER